MDPLNSLLSTMGDYARIIR